MLAELRGGVLEVGVTLGVSEPSGEGGGEWKMAGGKVIGRHMT